MNPVITCLIVEDEPPAMQLMEDYIKKLPMLVLKGKCYDALEALDFLKNNQVDVIFLDINLPALSGLELAGLIPPEQRIIFTTAYGEHALDSFAFHVVDYILKPISFKRFLLAIQKLQMHISPQVISQEPAASRNNDILFIKTGRKLVHVKFSEIRYIEANKEYLCINTFDQKYWVYKRMKAMATSLPDHFIRIHNSFIINIQYLEKTDMQTVFIADIELPISNTYKEQFQVKLKDCLL